MPWLILVLLIAVIFIVWIVLTNNAKKDKPDFKVSAHEAAPAEVAEAEPEMPAEASKAATGEEMARAAASEDDLTIVEGIGPKVSGILKQDGILTFRELGNADESRLKEILEKAGLQFMDPGTWAEQARLAADGRLEDLEALKSRLRGGRKAD